MEIHFKLEGFKEFDKLVDSAPNIIGSYMHQAMGRSLTVAQNKIQAGTPVDTGRLRGSEVTAIKGTPVNIRGEVYTDLAYGWPVEMGRKPGKMPPIDAIEAWVQRKLNVDNPRQVAFLIARAIGRRGTKGAFMFRRGFQQAVPEIIQIWTSTVDSIVIALKR